LNADTSEFAQFIKARSQALQRTAWLLTGDWGLAEDLVQTALARSWPRWDGSTAVTTPRSMYAAS
jgi:DNA-directed RNA polymerase specialized sigma24 family protein